MAAECEGIVIRRTRILKGRSMVLLLTDQFGKISAGTSLSERGKSRSALALRPFTVGRYQLRRDRDFINIVSGETLKSYFELAENYDKFLNASIAVELTYKALPEDAPAADIYAFLLEFLNMALRRRRDVATLTSAYFVKFLETFGVFPEAGDFRESELILTLDSDIVDVLMFLRENPISRVEKLALDSKMSAKLLGFLIRYAEAHLDIGQLKSALASEESS
jgi:DNA repair protein RecO (recombination protein O)